MLIITATKPSPSQIRFEFNGAAAQIEVARTALEVGSICERIEKPNPGLIVNVSAALLKAIVSLNLIETVDGAPFIPLFLPTFGGRSENHRQSEPVCI